MPSGRITKLTPKLRESICQALRAGNYIETAAAMNGIAKSSYYLWLRRGARERERLDKSKRARPKKSERPYLLFSDAVKKAEAQSEAMSVARIAKAGQEGAWQAEAWRLERKYPDRWGRKLRVDESVNQSIEVTVDERRAAVVSLIGDPDVRAAMALIHERRMGNGGNGRAKLIEAHVADPDPTDPAAH